MVKQRNIFEPNRIDILTDRKDTPQQVEKVKESIEAEGLTVIVSYQSKAVTCRELIVQQIDTRQAKLF